jgi:hypothetical protein
VPKLVSKIKAMIVADHSSYCCYTSFFHSWIYNRKGFDRSFLYIEARFTNHFTNKQSTQNIIILKPIYTNIDSKNQSLISKVWILLTNTKIVHPNDQGMWIERFYIQQINSHVYWKLHFWYTFVKFFSPHIVYNWKKTTLMSINALWMKIIGNHKSSTF